MACIPQSMRIINMTESKKLRRIAVTVAMGTFPLSFFYIYLSQLILSYFPSSFRGNNDIEYMGLGCNFEGFIGVLQKEFIAKCTFPYAHDLGMLGHSSRCGKLNTCLCIFMYSYT
jgi:hypothetical protein